MASEEALSTMRLEKREVEVKLEETKRELQLYVYHFHQAVELRLTFA
jgi:hypothetical protein